MQLQRTTTTDSRHPTVPTPRSTDDDAMEDTQAPKLRIDLLLYANMGAEALTKYLRTTKVATRRWRLGIDNKPANPTSATGHGTGHTRPARANTTTAPAGRQVVRGRSEFTADLYRVRYRGRIG